MFSVHIFMVGLLRFLCSGWWQHVVLPMIAEVLEEPPASIFKVEVSEMRMWPGYVGTMTQKVVIQKHRKGRGNTAITWNCEKLLFHIRRRKHLIFFNSCRVSVRGFQDLLREKHLSHIFAIKSQNQIFLTWVMFSGVNPVFLENSCSMRQVCHGLESSSTKKTICIIPQVIALVSLKIPFNQHYFLINL